MEIIVEILQYLLPFLLGGGIFKYWTWRSDRNKTDAETHKITADIHKTEAETEGIAVKTLTDVMLKQSEELKRLSGAVDEIEADRQQCNEKYETLHKEFELFRKDSAKQLKTINVLQIGIKKLKSEKADLDKKLKAMETENNKLILRVIELEKHELTN